MIWPFARRAKTRPAPSRRYTTLLWLALVSLLGGFVGLGEPIEDMWHSARNLMRSRPASGDIVVIAIDDKSLQQLSWPWPRRTYGALSDELRALGARRAFFNIDLPPSAVAADDRSVAESFARWSPKLTATTRFVFDPVTDARTDVLPADPIRRVVDLANSNFRYDYRGMVGQLPYAMSGGDGIHPSLAAKLAGVTGDDGKTFPIDYSINPQSIPAVSASDVLAGRVPSGAIAGKDVVVGITSGQLNNLFFAPGRGQQPGVYFHVLGAETLKRGTPIDLGWFGPFLAALAVAVLAVRFRPKPAVAMLLIIAVAIILLPLALDPLMLFVDIVPAAFLLIAMAGASLWRAFRLAYRLRGSINAISGLPNLNALREQGNHSGPLIAARVQNFAAIGSALVPDQEKELVEQIVARLRVGAPKTRIYQGDEGIFAWFAEEGMTAALGDHLEALHALFRGPVMVGNSQYDLTISFGVDASGERSPTNRLGSALVAADEAAREGSRWKVYDPAKLKEAAWKLSLLSQLDAAIEGGDLWVAFQPQVDLSTRRIFAAEALVRWTHPDKGSISPDEFIRAAEQNNRIEKLTWHVMNRAIEAAAAINGQGIPFGMSVNLSARLLDDPGLVPQLDALLARHGLDARLLTLEITETAALTTSTTTIEALERLRACGVQLSIDDYGTGLSTLDYLKRIPASEIKIDKSFIQAIDRSSSDRLMVQSTIQLAHSLGQRVVAEGVEQDETLQMLVSMGCDVAQGYLLGRPASFRVLVDLLLEERGLKAA